MKRTNISSILILVFAYMCELNHLSGIFRINHVSPIEYATLEIDTDGRKSAWREPNMFDIEAID